MRCTAIFTIYLLLHIAAAQEVEPVACGALGVPGGQF